MAAEAEMREGYDCFIGGGHDSRDAEDEDACLIFLCFSVVGRREDSELSLPSFSLSLLVSFFFRPS